MNNFILQEKNEFESQDLSVSLYTHITGAKILFAKNNENDINKVFSITLKTPAENNKGIPHILEHIILEGSKNFDFKSPCNELEKCSLFTYLNAITFNDKTMFPISSYSENDFEKIVSVYLDAIFCPNLEKEAFLQEGLNIDLKNKCYSGIVLNEMLAAYSDDERLMRFNTFSNLFWDSHYQYDSAGFPLDICDAKYEEIIEYYQKYYVPSNMFFYFYGNIDIQYFLKLINEKYLKNFISKPSPKIIFSDSKLKINYIQTKFINNENLIIVSYVIKNLNCLKGKIILEIFLEILNNYMINENLIFENFKFYLDYELISPVVNFSFNTNIKNSIFIKNKFDEIINCVLAEKINQKDINILYKKIQFKSEEYFHKYRTKGLIINFELINNWIYKESPFKYFQDKQSIKNLEISLQDLKKFVEQNLIYNKNFIVNKSISNFENREKEIDFIEKENTEKEIDFIQKEKSDSNLIENYLKTQMQNKFLIEKYSETQLAEQTNKLLKYQLRKNKSYELNKIDENIFCQNDILKKDYNFSDSNFSKKDYNFSDSNISKKDYNFSNSNFSIKKLGNLKSENINFDIKNSEIQEFKIENNDVYFIEKNMKEIFYCNLYFDISNLSVEKLKIIGLIIKLLGKINTKNFNIDQLTNNIDENFGQLEFSYEDFFDLNKNKFLNFIVLKIKGFVKNSKKIFENIIEMLYNTDFNNFDKINQIIKNEVKIFNEKLNYDNFEIGLILSKLDIENNKEDYVSNLSQFYFLNSIKNDFDFAKSIKNCNQEVFQRVNLKTFFMMSKKSFDFISRDFNFFLNQLNFEKNKFSIAKNTKVEQTKLDNIKLKKIFFEGQQYNFRKIITKSNLNTNFLTFNTKNKIGNEFKIIIEIIKKQYLYNLVRLQGGAYDTGIKYSNYGDIIFYSVADKNNLDTIKIFKDSDKFLKNLIITEKEIKNYYVSILNNEYMFLNKSFEFEKKIKYFFENEKNSIIENSIIKDLEIKLLDKNNIEKYAQILINSEKYINILGFIK